MMGNQHIIQKQVLEVEMENPGDAFQFRNRLGEVYHEMILPQLTILFDELGNGHKTYRIETINIDAGTIAKPNWEQELTDKIIAEARQAIQLREPVWKAPVTNPQPRSKAQSLIKNNEAEVINESREQEVLGQTEKIASYEFYELFETYLARGRLAWYATADQNLLQAFAALILPEKSLVLRLGGYLQTANDTVLLRLIYLLPNNSLNQLIQMLLHEKHAGLTKHFLQLVELVERILLHQSLKELYVKKGVYLPAFRSLYYVSTDQFISFLARQIVQYFKTNLPAILPEILQSLSPYDNPLQNAMINTIQSGISEKLEDRIVLPEVNEVEAVDGLFISNAGLVMLHPFLPQLFKELHLIEQNDFIDELCRMKAVLLTSYLATAEPVANDYDLMIEKVLCGLNPSAPIICNIELLEQERKEADDLLAQIIQLWKHNGVQVNGTVEGFRQSFLQRQGKLTQKQKDWRLQVQQLPYDMVLSSLPWSISMVKTPWMQGMIWIEWA